MEAKHSFIRRHWINLIGVMIGLIGIGVPVFYDRRAERLPTLLTDPVKTRIVDAKLFPNSSLKVVRLDGRSIGGDVNALQFYFWNAGEQSIKSDNVIKPLAFTLTDENAEILDYKILKVSRPGIINILLLPNAGSEVKSLTLDFNILEQGDGFTCQVIYIGDYSANVAASGVVEGGTGIRGSETVSQQQYWTEVRNGLPVYVPAIIGILVLVWVFRRWWRTLKSVESKAPTGSSRLKHVAGILSFSIAAVILMSVVLIFFVLLPRRSAKTNLLEGVPSAVKP